MLAPCHPLKLLQREPNRGHRFCVSSGGNSVNGKKREVVLENSCARMAMALVGLQTAATFSLAPQYTALLSNFLASPTSASPSSFSFSGQKFPLRLAFSPLLKGGSKAWRSTQQTSGGRRYILVLRATTVTVGPLSSPSMDAMENDNEKDGKENSDVELLACPLCFQPLSRKGIPGLTQQAITRSGFQCLSCKKAYSSRNVYLDLTITGNAKVYSETRQNGTELFRNPLVSFAYERGWRQNFQTAGFPGPDEEVKMAQEYLKPTYGGVLLDVSCGSGLFTRRFAKLDLYSAVVAIDFSENMLRQTFEYIKQDQTLLDKSIALVRADVARMPFANGSVDAVHAGAALHCWPSPGAGMAEISRILQPGGVFVATTFLQSPSFDSPILNGILQAILPTRQTATRYWKEAELEDLMRICGLVNYQRIRRQGFIMLTALKPE